MLNSLFSWANNRQDRTLAARCILALFLLLFIVARPLSSGAHVGNASQNEARREDQQPRSLELDNPIEGELAGDRSDTYRLALAAEHYVSLVIDQRGVDVIAQLSDPGGKPLMEFDSESRLEGRESVSLVAETAGVYTLIVRAKQKNAAAGRYEIRVVELRVATESDRISHEARKLYQESLRLLRAGKFDEALPLAKRSFELREKILGPDHPDVATPLNILGNLYRSKGENKKAETLYQRAVEIREKTQGPEHPDVAYPLNNLALLHWNKGEYEKAEPLYQRALRIFEQALGSEHSLVAACLNNFAALYHEKGDYERAEPFYRRALDIMEKTHGEANPDLAQPLSNLASLYRQRGDYIKAEQLYRRALDICVKAWSPEHPNVARILDGLAQLHSAIGDYAKAESFYRRALHIREKAHGPEHPLVASAINNLASVYYVKEDYANAEPLYQRALDIWEKAFGAKHPDVAVALNNLAHVCRARGDYAKAESLYRRALDIREKALGPGHPDVARSLNSLALLHASKGAIAQAVMFQSRADSVAERNITRNLASGCERQKLAYLGLFTKQTDFTLSLHSRIAPNHPQALDLALTTLLRRKGRGLDSMADTMSALRLHATPQDQALLDQLVETRSELAAHTLKEFGKGAPGAYWTQFKPLEEKVEQLEAELSVRSYKFRAQTQPVTLAAVQAALPANVALIEFAVYTPLEPQTEKSKPPRYLVYAFTAQGRPKWADLGETDPIDRAVDAWRKALRNPNRTDVNKLARAVDEKVMRPVRPLLGKTRRLLIAPDGALNLIPFAALVDEGNRFLIERYDISYLTSGLDLLRLEKSHPSENAPMVVANPAFGRAEIVARVDRKSMDSRPGDPGPTQNDTTRIYFQPLPSTGHEALAIKSLLPEASMFLREQATESALKKARAPSILHIATHGFFLSDQEALPAETRGVLGGAPLRASDLRLGKWAANIENPLLQSGLALSGANLGKSGDDDGLLTAMEVAGLDLWGTKLVVLSACDTGVGEVRNGEGVQGLRRALALAGSESQVMTLWSVLDNAAKDLMIPYYKALRQGEGRSAGLRRAQLRMLRNKDLRHPFYWAAFIQSGEWANLDGRRRPSRSSSL